MAAENWPVTLPQCFILGYSDGLADGVLEVQPDTGPPIARRRSSAMPRQLGGQMRMTRAQILIMKTFCDDTLDGGVLPFNFPDPTDTGETLLVRFAKGSLPAWQQTAAGIYRVNISLLVLP